MKSRPRQLTVLAIAVTLHAIALIPIFRLLLRQHSDHLTPDRWSPVLLVLIFCALVATAVAAWRAARVLLYLVPMTFIGILLLSISSSSDFVTKDLSRDGVSLGTALAAFLFEPNLVIQFLGLSFFVICLHFLSAPIVNLIRNPGRRWWLTPKRTKTALATKISLLPNTQGMELFQGKKEFYTQTLDISRTGAFIAFEPNGTPGRLKRQGREGPTFCRLDDVAPGTRVEIELSIDGIDKLVCPATIVRHSKPLCTTAGSLPLSGSSSNPPGLQERPGLGLRFDPLPQGEAMELSRLLRSLERF